MKKLSYGDENHALNKADVISSALTDMMAQITKNLADAEENVIKEVLRQILKREPTLEDAKDLHKFQREGKMGVEFVPFEMKDFLEPATNSDGTKVTF